MVVRRFFPKETDFFGMFEKAAQNLNRGALLLVEMMENFSEADIKAKQIYEVEQEGDMITHEVMRRLNKTFLTPIDREDIHSFISCLDDILDLIWATADRAILFKLESSIPEAVELSKTLFSTLPQPSLTAPGYSTLPQPSLTAPGYSTLPQPSLTA
ncbi:MAG: DUF47 family protein, partial [Candidatus Mariimomonas ferrooxydans]